MRISLNVPSDLLEKIDSEAKQLSISRSAFISMAISHYLLNNAVFTKMPDFMESFSKYLADKEMYKQLSDDFDSVNSKK